MSSFLLLLLVVALIYLAKQSRKVKAKDKELFQLRTTSEQQAKDAAIRENQLKSELSQLNAELNQLNFELNQLSQYRTILDAEQYAQQIRNQAQDESVQILTQARSEAARLRYAADEELRQARSQAREIREQAALKARTLQTQADGLLVDASKEAGRIIAIADQRAEEIAGEALAANRNAAELEKTIQALKNVLNGYGDQYLIPSYTLLDELAEDYAHVEAGTELKKARERTRLMVTNRTAAKCDYVEFVRSTSAVNFVTDAFNGKVDTILASVKHDNYGTLAQQIKDAYALVNHLGKPFRDARITYEYLQARLEELRWATIAHELKLKEREEQRLIKEQIREEEKARRDFEKAQREAAKQEDVIQKAIDKVQQQAAKASAEQQAVFEQQLLELENRLQVAQEKNQRALSMAQQTKSGHVYIISNVGSFGEHVYKIGMTRRLEPLDRVRELGDASVPFEFDVHAMLFSNDAPALERDLHRHFLNNQVNKVNPRKEFFRVDLTQIRSEIERLGIETKWTLTAEAREYRESLAVEQALANNTIDRAEWEKFQMENIPTEIEVEEQEI
ncbi:DUF4041 domain-containing protein [Spirosoma sp. RP8]|uniref:DUF4041 domain-containing protein n=1 Tax=Spirosoma liriopis TaxID=2937440 RepID=A0ABT0HV18_9BACT|nr:DUF4041 domain-containing protein [Spirosoma liriopis]MCK8496052.1 DUF4041 domain-containing protein [Spirosoma liriopis]